MSARKSEKVETVIIGGGQAGLAAAYHLQKRGRSAVILDANQRVGDSWRERWDSLRLFTPAKLSSLPGMRYPGPGWSFPTKDEFADYLEAYAERFELDVRNGCRVQSISHPGDVYIVEGPGQCFEGDQVIIATGGYQEPKVPVFAPELSPGIVQLHSSAYRNPQQLQPGPVLVVGSGNSGGEIALELASEREVVLACSDVPTFPVRPGSLASRFVMPAFLFFATYVLTTGTPMGRRMRPQAQQHAAPLIRVKPRDLAEAGVRRVGKVAGVSDGRPRLEDGTLPDVTNVIWCTGFRSNFSWIDLPAFTSPGEPAHDRGVLRDAPGLYFVGQRFQHALSSSFIGGVGRDAGYVAKAIDRRVRALEKTGGSARQHASTGV